MLKIKITKLISILIVLSFVISFSVINTNEKNRVSAATTQIRGVYYYSYTSENNLNKMKQADVQQLISSIQTVFDKVPDVWKKYVNIVYFKTYQDYDNGTGLGKYPTSNYPMHTTKSNNALHVQVTKLNDKNQEVACEITSSRPSLNYLMYHEIAHLIDKRYGEEDLRPYSGEEGIYKVGGKNFYEIWRATNWEQDALFSEAFATAVGRYKYEEIEKVNQTIPAEIRKYLKEFISDIETGRTGDVNIKLIGDVNCDKIINTADLTLLANVIANKATLTAQGLINANCHISPGINSDDLLALQKYLSDRSLVLPLS